MGKRSKKTTKTAKTVRTEAQIRAELAVASAAENTAVEAVKGKHDDKGIARGWEAAERTNVLLRELTALTNAAIAK